MKKYFDLKVGFTCNNFCRHCVITDKKETCDYTTQEIKNIIDGISEDYIIGFTGGEASIRKDWVEIVKYAKETGHETALQTNGVAFHNKALAHETAKYLDSALVAIHSHIPEIHNTIVDCPSKANMFEKTKQGFLNLIEEGVDVKTQTVISKYNIKALPETYDWIQSLVPGINMSFTFPHPNGNALHNFYSVVPKYSDIEQEIQKIISKWGHLLTTEAIPMCYLYPYQDRVENCDEEISQSLGDIRAGIDPANKDNQFFDKNGITQNYNLADISGKRKIKECKYCMFNDRCLGVWKEYMEGYISEIDLKPILDPKKMNGTIIIPGRDKCDNTCVFCYGTNKPESDEIKFQKFMHDAQYFIDNNYYKVEISGADPGEFKYIVEAILYLKEAGIPKIQLSTHGRMFADRALAEKLSFVGLDYIRIPLYGSTKEIHNRTADFKNLESNSFDETIKAIKNCSEYGITICGSSIINQYNKNDINNIISLYKDLTDCNLSEIIINIAYLSETMLENIDKWHIPVKDLGPYIEEILLNKPELPEHIKFAFMDIPYCVIGRYDKHLEQSTIPNLGEHNVEIENSDSTGKIPKYRIKQSFGECLICKYNSICSKFTCNEIQKFGTDNLRAIREEN